MQSTDQLINSIAQRLSVICTHTEQCYQYAWWILTFITGKQRSHLIAHPDLQLTAHQKEKLEEIINQMVVQHKPLQYIMGEVPFLDAHIVVRPPVLIPRPETEEWTAWLIEQLQPIKHEPLAVIDMCTGSGCIAIALAQAFAQATVYATDIADHALACAQENIRHNRVQNITLVKSDLFDALPDDFKFDLIVANPPYIAPEEWSELDASVAEWEDKNALIAPDHGLALIFAIIKQAPRYLKQNPFFAAHHVPQLMIEIGHQQGPIVKAAMEKTGFVDVQIKKDSAGKDRVVMGMLP